MLLPKQIAPLSSASLSRCLSRRRCTGHVPRAADIPEGVAWDPEGLLPPAGAAGGHFARRAASRQPTPATTAERPAGQPQALQAASNAFSLPALVTAEPLRSACESTLRGFMPLDLDAPGLTVLHLDPPIFTAEHLLSDEECQNLINAAEATGQLRASLVGAGNAAEEAVNAMTTRRTSRSMLLQDDILAAHPRLGQLAGRLQQRARALLQPGEGETWGRTGRLPRPGQYCFEALQVAVYHTGQYFMSHEDAFPTDLLPQNMFQRAATVLVYLNDVQEGGATYFEKLDLSVQPARGKALIFFPAFADGTPDARTLHTATDAKDTKWIAQQWVACGYQAPSTPGQTFQVVPGLPSVVDDIEKKAGKKARGKKGVRQLAGKGFGAK